MKTLFPKSALSRKSDTSHLFPYSLIFSLIRGIMAVDDQGFFATKGSFKNKGLIRNHDMI